MVLIATFYISLLGILGMFAFKAFELRTGRESLLSRITSSANHIVHARVEKTKRILSMINRRNALLRKSYRSAREKFFKKFPKLHEVMSGKGSIRKKGSVSFFLQSIKEDANEVNAQ
jgi:hypothetical protein